MVKILRNFLIGMLLLILLSGVGVAADLWVFKRVLGLPILTELLPWPMQIGLKIKTIREQTPIIDRVVIVPDTATFMSEIKKWSYGGHWPILIDDPKYTPLFLARFKPEETIRVPAVKTPLPKGEKLQELMINTVANTWGTGNEVALRYQWSSLGWEPPGIVITSETDPAWPAAVALAADRGQPLAFLADDFGKPNDTLDEDRFEKLKTTITEIGQASGYSYQHLGDTIDTVTIVRDMAVKYNTILRENEQLAVTDGLGRHNDGKRWAIVGWIYGSPSHAVYQAMCGIFIDIQSALLYDSYPSEGSWKEYEMDTPKQKLSDQWMPVKFIKRPESGVKTWLKLVSQPLDSDLIFVNSRGNKDDFFVGDGNVTFKDVPKLKSPAIVHFLHSWSATAPTDINTVAGQWLENGAYAYVGSVHEPFLTAFVPPKTIVERMQSYSPFLVAARHLDKAPWKITTIGDPLITLTKKPDRYSPKAAPYK